MSSRPDGPLPGADGGPHSVSIWRCRKYGVFDEDLNLNYMPQFGLTAEFPVDGSGVGQVR
jgi:hypothetical protein